MEDISVIDVNFKVNTQIEKDDIRFYDVNQKPFQIYGVFYEDGLFRRMPETVALSVSQPVYNLHIRTAGGRVRFQTDSPYIAIHAKMPYICKMPHFALTGSAGFDLYEGYDQPKYVQTFVPPVQMEDGYEGIREFPEGKMREITINFPLYSAISELYIGLSEKAVILPPKPYRVEKPVVYYGSSITQGGCASRPGNSYQSIVSRRLNCNYINLGFSGNAKAEDEIAEYIAGLDMSVFVYDYDHNAPTIEHLEKTHERMFRIIRKANPDLPIVMMSRPKCYLTQSEERRLEIIRTTYQHAKESGDENVYLIDNRMLTELCGNEGTVDNCHPNDFGFAAMAKAVGDVLEKLL